ncbi:hypothetical protein CEB3_c02680 [Peptococcaceae bacterium CEB3]|nr:hypothetical protein CEB3_c02680 [Peptococcaceae bacterium CEB3]
MKKVFVQAAVTLVSLLLLTAGCSQTAPNPAATGTADLTNKVNNIVAKAIPRFSTQMKGVSDSFDNVYYAAKGGNWALAKYMADLANNFMSPTQITKPQLYSLWASFDKANLAANSPLDKALNSKDFSAFKTAYNNVISNCNSCHASQGFKYIQKVKAGAPVTNLNFSASSEPSDFH